MSLTTSSVTLGTLRQQVDRSGLSPQAHLEQRFDLVGALELRRQVTISESGQSLVPTPAQFAYFEPHPYVEAGAPYGSVGPFVVRADVAERLKVAQTFLEERIPGARLKLFDCFRPKGVQIYMRDRTFKEYAGEMQLDLMTMSEDDRAAVWRRVDALWARPSDDSSCPTPHSTGGAVDVTYVGDDGVEVDMGSSLDESSARILPAHYDGREDVPSKTFADRRELLRDVMESAGFTRLSHEWWHFSYGDQFWALIESLRTGENVAAIYGEVAV